MDTSARPRKRRIAYNLPNHAHELTFSTFRRKPIFLYAEACELFVEALDAARTSCNFELWAFVIMPDHCHVLLRPRDEVYAISAILKAIKSPAAKAILERFPEWREELSVCRPTRGREARLWQQGGGYDRNICTNRAAAASINYIHMNPVRKGLCDNPEDWPWTSYRAYLNPPEDSGPVTKFVWQE